MGFDEAGNVVGSFSIDANALNCLRIFRVIQASDQQRIRSYDNIRIFHV